MDDTFFDIPVHIKSKFDEKLAEVFRLFDYQSNNMILSRDLGSILRILGLVPTEEEIQKIITETEFQQRKGTIHLANLMTFLRKMIETNKMQPYSSEELLDCFKILDPKSRGYIPKEEFLKSMREVGEVINKEQLDEMLKVCLDPHDNRVYYEDYIRKISYEPEEEESLFTLVRHPRRSSYGNLTRQSTYA